MVREEMEEEMPQEEITHLMVLNLTHQGSHAARHMTTLQVLMKDLAEDLDNLVSKS